jgi:hypothetical protein
MGIYHLKKETETMASLLLNCLPRGELAQVLKIIATYCFE